MNKNLFIIVFGIVLSAFLQSCNEKFYVHSIPAEADVSINGRYKGKTPAKFNAVAPNHAPVFITLTSPGYESLDTFVMKSNKINWFTRIMGYVFVFPLDFDKKFKPTYKFTLQKKENIIEKENTVSSVNTIQTKSQKLLALKNEYDNQLISKKEFIERKKRILEE